MNVEIYSAGQLVGVAHLTEFDPSMGVAIGAFKPAAGYRRSIHAFEVDGENNESFLQDSLSARASSGTIECEGVAIADYQDTLGEIQARLLGVADFESYFGNLPNGSD